MASRLGGRRPGGSLETIETTPAFALARILHMLRDAGRTECRGLGQLCQRATVRVRPAPAQNVNVVVQQQQFGRILCMNQSQHAIS